MEYVDASFETDEALVADVIGAPAPMEGPLSRLAAYTWQELQQQGFTPQAASRFLSAVEIGRRAQVQVSDDEAPIRSSQQIVDRMQPRLVGLQQEELWVLLLNTRGQLRDEFMVYRGTVDGMNCRAAEVLRPAVRGGHPKIAMVHNHPSGNPSPSEADLMFTRRCLAAGRDLDIEIIDHVVIGGVTGLSLRAKAPDLPWS